MNKIILLSIIIMINSVVGCSKISKVEISNSADKEVSSPILSEKNTSFGSAKIFLTKDRKAVYKSKIDNNHESWLIMINQLEASIDQNVWNKAEFSSAYALAYHNTGDIRYLNKAKALFWQVFTDFGYKSLSDFSSYSRYAHYTFDWIKDSLTESEYKSYITLFKLWSNYWLDYVDYKKGQFRNGFSNTIETTSLSEGFFLLAQSLKGSDIYEDLITVSNKLLSNYYDGINDKSWIKESGGVTYHPSQMEYWLRTALMNKDNQNSSNNRVQKFLNYEFHDIENDTDYSKSRYELMLVLANLVEDVRTKGLCQFWLNKAAKSREKHVITSGSTGLWRFLFDHMDFSANAIAKKILVDSNKIDEEHSKLFLDKGKTKKNKSDLFLTDERLASIHKKMNYKHASWRYLISRLEKYYNVVPYGSARFVSAYALAYKIGGDTRYLKKAKELFLISYKDWNYKSRNDFRAHSHHAHLAYSWIKNDLSASEKDVYKNIFGNWATYWLEFVNYENNFSGYRVGDSDETTSLAENLLLLAISLDGSKLADKLYAASDAMLNKFVVGQFMNGHMAGGMWGEGSYYSAGTMEHWVRAFILNKELRGIPYPNKYMQDVILATIHNTYPGFTGMFQYGDVQAARDYARPLENHRYDLMISLIDGVSSPEFKSLGQDWLNKSLAEGHLPPNNSGYTGLWRVLFEKDSASQAALPIARELDTTFYAPGIEMLAMRDSWEDDGSVVYMQSGKGNVDHAQKDALSFNIVSDGVNISKEMTGYGRSFAGASVAHNTLLIEHNDNTLNKPVDSTWGSSIKSRPLGNGSIRAVDASDDYAYAYADGTQLYNLKWWDREREYTNHVTRKLFFIKPDVVIVYDHIDLNKEYGLRQIKYIQHFQSKPSLSNGIYSAESEGKTFQFKTLFPSDVATTIIDEKKGNFWGGGLNSSGSKEIPANQLKWHLSVSPFNEELKTELINILSFGDQATHDMPDATVINKESGNMPSANMVGTHVDGAGKDHIVLFNNNLSDAVPAAIEYSIKSLKASQHYLTGLSKNAGYSVVTKTAGSKLTVVIKKGGSVSSNATGTLVFNLDKAGNLK